jgi:MFS family permease
MTAPAPAAPDGVAPSTTFAPFRSRDYRLVWTGSLLSNIGTWMETVALGFYVADTTGKNTWSAVVVAAGFLPSGVIGPIGSAMADRLDRRRVILVGNLIAGIIAAVVAVWVGSGSATPAGLAVLSLLAGITFAFFFPSYQTVLPELVPREHLVAAIGLSNAQWNLGRVIGPACAALAIWIGGIGAALWINAASFIFVIIAVSLTGISTRRGERRPVFAALVDGVRFARQSHEMRSMLWLMLPTVLVAAPFIAFVAQMATNVHDGGERATSFLTTAQGVGAVVAAVALGALTKRLGVGRVLATSVLVLGPALVLYGLAPSLWTAALALAAVGLTYGLSFTAFASVAQLAAPDEMRGRVLAVNSFVLGIGYPVGVLISGPLADAVGLRQVTVASGLIMLAVALARFRPTTRTAP